MNSRIEELRIRLEATPAYDRVANELTGVRLKPGAVVCKVTGRHKPYSRLMRQLGARFCRRCGADL